MLTEGMQTQKEMDLPRGELCFCPDTSVENEPQLSVGLPIIPASPLVTLAGILLSPNHT